MSKIGPLILPALAQKATPFLGTVALCLFGNGLNGLPQQKVNLMARCSDFSQGDLVRHDIRGNGIVTGTRGGVSVIFYSRSGFGAGLNGFYDDDYFRTHRATILTVRRHRDLQDPIWFSPRAIREQQQRGA